MTDEEVRELIRLAIQKHLGTAAAEVPAPSIEPTLPSMSFGRYRVVRIADDNMCLIEPAVKCNHCGYCECHGH